MSAMQDASAMQEMLIKLREDYEAFKKEMSAAMEAKDAAIEEIAAAKDAEIAAKNAEIEKIAAAKDAAIEAKNAEIEAKNSEIGKIAAAKDAEIEAKNAEIEKIAAAKDAAIEANVAKDARIANFNKTTIGWLMDSDINDETLNLTKAFGSHIHTTHQDATSSEHFFELDSITYRDDEVNDRTSCILAAIQKSKEYSNEASIQHYVAAVLNDAVDYANWVLRRMNPGSTRSFFKAMPEAGIFSNKPDHLVVYTNDGFKIPIICVEVKNPMADPNDVFTSQSVGGQLLDYLMVARFMKGLDSFGVLTTYNHSKVVWLDNKCCDDLATAKGRLQEENLRKICAKVISERAADPANRHYKQGTPSAKAPIGSPAAAVASPNSSVEGGNETCSTQSTSPTPSLSDETPVITRCIKISVHTYKPCQLFAVFCNAIFASLQVGHKKRQIYRGFEANGKLDEGQLVLHLWTKTDNKKAYAWQTLKKSIDIKGNWVYKQAQKKFFVVEYLGAGLTSRAWRAVVVNPSQKKGTPQTGYSCVIKYWIKDHNLQNGERYDAKKIENEAKKATDKEVANYRAIYKSFKTQSNRGRYCRPLVGSVELNSRWCTILPFFRPLQEHERNEETLIEIAVLLRQKFYVPKKSYQFKESDQRWRHVGKFKEKVVLFDLGDLQEMKISKNEHEQYVNAHIAVLRDRMNSDRLET